MKKIVSLCQNVKNTSGGKECIAVPGHTLCDDICFLTFDFCANARPHTTH